ncbi:murein L,D-transpeptidase [Arsukibacterium sp.]|uniref:L,D-transpeptidase family protein n=1 Tax=Arsukibacterium sp. TaxID=1977258 RepID=UPI0035696F99
MNSVGRHFNSLFKRFFQSLSLCGLLLTPLSVTALSESALTLRQHIEANLGDYPLSAFGIPLKNDTTLQDFYLNRNFSLAWYNQQGKLTAQARAVIQEIGDITKDGLLPADYYYEKFQATKLLENNELTTNSRIQYDLLLSDAVATLSQHLIAGKVDPKTLAIDWSAQRRHRDLVKILQDIAQGEDVAARINALRPNQVRYFRLQKLLTQLEQRAAPEWHPLATAPLIKPLTGDKRVEPIRERLIYWGDLTTIADENITASSQPQWYDELLVSAVKNFQRRHGLDEDGIIGKHTLEALNISPAMRKQQVVNNLERWRWLAEDLGDKHVLVNIASFELRVIANNETVMRKPVIVGRDYRRTPVFSDKIRYLVYNPTWTVPYSIASKDILPNIQKDPEYLNQLNFKVYDRNQSLVDPATVNWKAITKNNFPYRLVQMPGPKNALGQIKFMFPNEHDVYLHDTAARDLFSKKDRAFSSGCVRVSDPLELAAWLQKDNGISRADIDAILASGEPKTMFLKKPIPVHIEYWTGWVDSKGVTHFRADIYQRDPPLTAALERSLHAE